MMEYVRRIVSQVPVIFVNSGYLTERAINGSANWAGNAFWDPIVALTLTVGCAK